MHRLEFGLGSQAGQGAGSSSEAGHEQSKQDSCDPQALR